VKEKTISDEVRIEFYRVARLEHLMLTKKKKKKRFLFFFDKNLSKIIHMCRVSSCHRGNRSILKVKLARFKF